jgi:hypothetical protein
MGEATSEIHASQGEAFDERKKRKKKWENTDRVWGAQTKLRSVYYQAQNSHSKWIGRSSASRISFMTYIVCIHVSEHVKDGADERFLALMSLTDEWSRWAAG